MYIGYRAGYSANAYSNTFIGAYSGKCATGACNVALGQCVCFASNSGNYQLAIGSGANNWIDGTCDFDVTLAGIVTVTKATGVLEATKFCGDGSCLTNLPGGGSGGCLKLVQSTNLVSDGTCAGCCLDGNAEYNVILGCCAGHCLKCGSMNVLIGRCAGYGTTISGCSGGGCNVIIGMGAGKCGNDGNFSANVFIGCEAARTYCYNSLLAVGSRAAYSATGTNGWMNTVVGTCAGYCSASGQSNTFVGSRAGKFNASGSYNAFFGFEAMGESDSGSNNVVLGAVSYTHLPLPTTPYV